MTQSKIENENVQDTSEVAGKPPETAGEIAVILESNDTTAASNEIPAVILGFYEKEESEWNQDDQEVQESIALAEYWRDSTRRFLEHVTGEATEGSKLVDSAQQRLVQIQQQGVSGYGLDGLELIVNKMLPRAVERIASVIEENVSDSHLPRMGYDNWKNLFDDENDAEVFTKKANALLKKMSSERYKVINLYRDGAAKQQKNVLNIAEKQWLPILDGLYDGKNHLESIKVAQNAVAEESDTQFASSIEHLYDYLIKELLSALEKIHVSKMSINKEDPIDYARHEPFDVEDSNGELPDDSIKEVMRHGYEYKSYGQREVRVLRAAQVIVVKNQEASHGN